MKAKRGILEVTILPPQSRNKTTSTASQALVRHCGIQLRVVRLECTHLVATLHIETPRSLKMKLKRCTTHKQNNAKVRFRHH